MKTDLKEFLEKDDYYFSESHLYGWYDKQYQAKLREEVIYMLNTEHDTSCEIDNAENEIGRELSDHEKIKVVERFNAAVMETLVFRNDVVVGFYDSMEELKRKGN